jgi:hypothetical protein
MDKDALVTEQAASGDQLIRALAADGFETRVAFWAKPTDEGKWFLYLASPTVDDQGPTAAYHLVHRAIRQMPDLWVEPLEVRVLRINDSLTEAALEVIKPKTSFAPSPIRHLRLYHGLTPFRGDSLGGLSIDGAYIYPTYDQSTRDAARTAGATFD